VWSVQGEGSTFTLSLPAFAGAESPAGTVDVSPAQLNGTSPHPNGATSTAPPYLTRREEVL
jgi:hypothetical protein